jgi:hypothetical protein
MHFPSSKYATITAECAAGIALNDLVAQSQHADRDLESSELFGRRAFIERRRTRYRQWLLIPRIGAGDSTVTSPLTHPRDQE